MEENKKINIQIVIMVVIVIILILSLLGILLYVVYENNSLENNQTNTTTTITTTTTTVPVVEDDKSIVVNVIEEYLLSLKSLGKIDIYQYEVTLLTEEDYCPGKEYYPDKIYANVDITYKRKDETFVINNNDNNTNTGSEDVFETTSIYVISKIEDKYQIEDSYLEC